MLFPTNFFCMHLMCFRCKIPECEGTSDANVEWRPSWLMNAIPYQNDVPDKCTRYVANSSLAVRSMQRNECPADRFNRNHTVKCNEFVYKVVENELAAEFQLVCENEYKLAFIGMANSLARFFGLPLVGMLSDRYIDPFEEFIIKSEYNNFGIHRFGRLTVLIWGTMVSSALGVIQAFASNIYMYLTMEFLTSLFSVAVYSSGFVLAVEWVSSKYRIYTGILMPIFVPISEIIIASIAMFTTNFRTLLLIIYAPGLLTFVYHWLLPESTRWLYATSQYAKGEQNLKQMAQANHEPLTQHTMDDLRHRYENEKLQQAKSRKFPVLDVFTKCSRTFRFFSLSLVWMASTFVYYGVGIISAQLHIGTNKYINFMIISSAEIPGNLLATFLLNRLGRRPLICGAMALNGLAIFATTLTTNEYLILFLFVFAKFSIVCAFSSTYIFTAELWPTYLRHTMLGMCSMIGRLGTLCASAATLLIYISPQLPFYVFTAAAWTAAALLLFNPETNGHKLPETFEEIEKLSENKVKS